MGYLSLIFNKYYKKRDIKIIDEFRDRLWSSLPYQKINKYYSFRICEDKIQDDNVLKEFEKYKYIEYKILKSRYNLDNVTVEDLVRARVNSNYGKYFDKEVYLGKQYYYQLVNYKNIYFKYINEECDNPIEELNNNAILVDKYKQGSIEKKIDLSWKDYKKFINGCIPKIFDNYIPMDNLVEEGRWRPNEKLEWDEDNYIVKYINKSLDGYIKKYVDEIKGIRVKIGKEGNCICCGKSFIKRTIKNTSQLYCDICSKEKEKEKHRIRQKKYKNKMKR
jgi:hypothetical protein